MKATARTLKKVKLGKDAMLAFDRHKSEAALAKPFRAHDAASKQAKEQLEELFGDADLGLLPDGRVIARNQKTQDRAAQPAKQVSWNEFNLLGS